MAETEIDRLVVRIVGDGSSYSKTLQRAVRETYAAGREVQRATKLVEAADRSIQAAANAYHRLGEEIKTFGNNLNLYVTAPLAGIGALATKAMTGLESQVARLKTMTGASATTIAALRAKALELAPALGKYPEELIEAFGLLEDAGFEGARAIDIVTRASKASTAGFGDLRSIIEATALAMNTYGPSVLSSARATDILVETMRSGRVEIDRLLPTLSHVLPIAAELGVSFEDVGASIAFLSRTTKNSVTASMELRGLLFQLSQSEFDAKLKKIGLSAQQLYKDIKTQGLPQALRNLRAQVEGKGYSFKSLFSGTEGYVAAMQMTGDRSEQLIAIQRRLKENLGIVDRAFSEVAKTTKFEATQALVEMNIQLIEIGAVIKPFISQMTLWNRTMIAAWKQLSPETRRVIILIAMAAAALGPALTMLSLVPRLLGSAISRLSFFLIPLHLAARGFDGLATQALRWGSVTITTATTVGNSLGTMISRSVTGLGSIATGALAAGSRIASSLGQAAVRGRDWFTRLRETGRNVLTQMQDYVTSYYRGWVLKDKPARDAHGRFIKEQYMLVRRFGYETQYYLTRPFLYYKAFVSGLADAFPGVTAKIAALMDRLSLELQVKWLRTSARVRGAMTTIGDWWASVQQRMHTAASQRWAAISTAVTAKWAAISGPIVAKAHEIAQRAGAAFARVSAYLSPVTSRLGKLFAPVMPLITQDTRKIGRLLTAAGQVGAMGIKASMTGAFAFIRGAAAVTGGAIRRMGGGLVMTIEAITNIASLLGSAGGSLGKLAGILGTVATVGPILASIGPLLAGIGAIVGAILSPVGLVTAAVVGLGYAFIKFSDTGRKALEYLKKTFLPIFSELFSIGKDTFAGITAALKNGQWSIAGKIAMAGLGAAWTTGLAFLMDNWGGFVHGLVNSFGEGAKGIATLWLMTQNSITKGILGMAEQKGVIGDIWAKILGVDVRKEREREQRINQQRSKLGLAPLAGFDYNSIIDQQTLGAVNSITQNIQNATNAVNRYLDPKALHAKAEAYRKEIRKLTVDAVVAGATDSSLAASKKAAEEAGKSSEALKKGLVDDATQAAEEAVRQAAKATEEAKRAAQEALKPDADSTAKIAAMTAAEIAKKAQAIADQAAEAAKKAANNAIGNGLDTVGPEVDKVQKDIDDIHGKKVDIELQAKGVEAVEARSKEMIAAMFAYRDFLESKKTKPVVEASQGVAKTDVKGKRFSMTGPTSSIPHTFIPKNMDEPPTIPGIESPTLGEPKIEPMPHLRIANIPKDPGVARSIFYAGPKPRFTAPGYTSSIVPGGLDSPDLGKAKPQDRFYVDWPDVTVPMPTVGQPVPVDPKKPEVMLKVQSSSTSDTEDPTIALLRELVELARAKWGAGKTLEFVAANLPNG